MKKYYYKLFLLCSFFNAVLNLCFGQPNFQHIESFTKKDGLPGNKVTDILPDDAGFLWITTNNGLVRYDGSEFHSFMPYSGEFYNLTNYMNRVISNGHNNLVISSFNGLFLFNTQKYTFRKIDFSGIRDSPLDSGFKPYLNMINFLEKDCNGNIWAGTQVSLYRLDSGLHLRKVFWSEYTRKDLYSKRLNYVFKILPLNKEILLAWLDSKPYIWQKSEGNKGETFIPVENWERGRLAFLKDIPYANCFGFKGRYLIYFRNNTDSMFIYDALTDRKASCYFQYMNNRDFDWQQVVSILSDEWLALSMENNAITFIHITDTDNRLSVKHFPERIFGDYNLGKIIADHEGNFWITGKKGGLFKVTSQRQKFSIKDLPNPRIPDHAFRISCLLRKGENILLGSYGEGLYEWNPTSGKINLHLNRVTSNVAWANRLWNLRNGKGDTVWVGTQMGLFWYHVKKKTFGYIPGNHPKELNLQAITVQFTDSHGDIWIGVGKGNGVVRYESKSGTYTHFKNNSVGYPYRYPVAVAEDSKSDIWFLSDNTTNLVKWDRKAKQFSIVPLNIPQLGDKISWSVLLIDQEDNAWFGTQTLGLICYSLTTHTYKLMRMEYGIALDFLSGLYLDSQNRLWAASNSDLIYFDKNINRFVSYNFDPDAKFIEKSGPFYFDSASRKLYVPFFRRVVSFNPQALKDIRPPMKVILTGVTVMDRLVPVPPMRQLRLNPDQNDITISFSGINLSDGIQNQYSYRIGSGKWISLGMQRKVRFARLAPGKYDLQIRGARNNEDWSPDIANLRIIVKPPFTSTIWFILICVVMAVMLVYFWYRYRLAQVLKIQKIRENISRDLHDELGSRLTSIGYLSLIAQNKSDGNLLLSEMLQKINESSVDASSSMREIIAEINPELDKLNTLIPGLIQYTASILEIKGITLYSQVDTIPPSAKLSLYKRRDFKMIFMETVNNIIKHSDASKVGIRLKYERKIIYLTIEDDGKGFSTIDNRGSGNGLKNMKARAASHDWKLNLSSAEGKGTILNLRVKIT